ncbi:Cytochrome b(N-terminal)/b6/petB [Serratia quinivorans]|uniref:cytochrome b n=1 Tax=Serratia quinivorans TaxID=137545 RepID=UPI0021784BDB|nr:cytochrome b/b6 domain-containing protein [Serratia quinivorans]CAI1927389.1 Cytochrome b(N-terminal)/b6/petB [Serratia quinivorans]
MNVNKYTTNQVVLHWLSAAVITWAIFSGFYVSLLSPSEELKSLIGFVNVSLTTVFIPFFLLRTYYFITLDKPKGSGLSAKNDYIAHIVHWGIYLNIIIALISGVLMMERDINVFHLLHIPQPIDNLVFTGRFNMVHITSCATLSGLVLLHVLAVIKHTLTGKNVLKRMSI